MSTPPTPRPDRLDTRVAVGLGAGAAAMYLATRMQVHVEVNDAITFASYVERGRLDELFHGSHLVYLWVAQAVHRLARLVVPGLESNVTTQAFDALVGGAGVGVFYLVAREVASRRPLALVTTGLFAVSYHYWMFAAGIEVFVPAVLCILAALLVALRLPDGPVPPSRLAALTAATALAILFHLASGMLGAVGIFLLLTRARPDGRPALAPGRWRSAVLYAAATGAVVVAAYAVVVVFVLRFGTAREVLVWVAQFTENDGAQGALRLGRALEALPFGIGRALLGVLPWFAVPGLGPAAVDALSGKCLAEELFAVRNLGGFLATVLAVAGVVGATLVGVLGLAALAGLISARGRLGRAELALALWVALYTCFNLWFEPGNPEWWSTFWLPFVYLLVASGLGRLGSPPWIMRAGVLAVAALLVANGGAMLLQTDARNDMYRVRLDWYSRNAAPSDLVIHSGGYGWTGYVEYYVAARKLPLSDVLQSTLAESEARARASASIRETLARGGRVFVTADALEPDRCRAEHRGWDLSRNERFAAWIRPSLDCRERDGSAVCAVDPAKLRD